MITHFMEAISRNQAHVNITYICTLLTYFALLNLMHWFSYLDASVYLYVAVIEEFSSHCEFYVGHYKFFLRVPNLYELWGSR